MDIKLMLGEMVNKLIILVMLCDVIKRYVKLLMNLSSLVSFIMTSVICAIFIC